jgi:hypothetical protein
MSVTLMKLKASELDVDVRVQREEEPAQCRKLAKGWNDMLVGNLTASYRDGEFFLVDGQQRYTTKMKYLNDPDYLFDVLVHDDLTVKDEGRMFLAMNRDHKAVSAYDKFHVAVAIGEEPESTVNKIITALGYSIARTSSEKGIGAPAAILRIYNSQGVAALTFAIQTNVNAKFNKVGKNQWDALFLEGAAIFYDWHKDHPEFDSARLGAQLGSVKHGKDVTDLVKAARYRTVTNNRAVGAMADVLTEVYNSNLRTPSKRLEHR